MATEASRSTSTAGPADSYIGSVISLTSKSEIRYEGILFTINTQEASIGLRNVRSFGTEGRRTDAQVPASDKVYEYIVFRGSDIKDLQVKSSPPVQTPPPVHNDPAIIQSQYAPPSASSNLPTAPLPATGSLSDLNNQMPQPGPPPLTSYQNTMPMYQPGGNIPKWNPSIPPTPNVTGLSMPMYWQGYYGPSGPNQAQQPLLRPVQGLPEPPSMQPPLTQQLGQGQHSSMNPSLPIGASNISVSQSAELTSPLLQPVISRSLPVQSSTLPSDSSTNLMFSKAPDSSLVSNLSPDLLDKSTVGHLVPNQFNGLSDSLSDAGKMSTSPVLVTPGQFLKPGPTISSTGQMEQKDVEVVEVPPPPPPQQASIPVSTEAQAPLLPLPSPSNMNGVPSQTRYVNRGGRDRRRVNEFSHPVANFNEEFDFEAMNEKFKKDEVWGHLGKSKAKADDELDFEDEDDVNLPKVDVTPVYKKDDFFDTLSSNALDRESRNGRTRFSEQMKLDTETFGNFQRNRGYRGGRGPGGGRSRGGGYHGRGNGYGYGYGYGYGGRGGRGNSVYRAF